MTKLFARSRTNRKSLRLKVLDDLCHSRHKLTEKVERINLSQVGMGKAYKEGGAYIQICLTTLTDGHDYCFTVFYNRRHNFTAALAKFDGASGQNAPFIDNRRGDQRDPMLMRPGNSSQQSEHIISTFIKVASGERFERCEDGVKFGSDVFALIEPDCFLEVVRAATKREMTAPLSFSGNMKTSPVNCLIESVAQIFDYVGSDTPHSVRQRFRPNDKLVHVCFGIFLYHHSAVIRLGEGLNHILKIKEFSLRVTG